MGVIWDYTGILFLYSLLTTAKQGGLLRLYAGIPLNSWGRYLAACQQRGQAQTMSRTHQHPLLGTSRYLLHLMML